MPLFPTAESDVDQKVIDSLSRGEIHFIHVFDPQGNRFSYTVGRFLLHNQPEFIVFGLPVENATRVLSGANQVLQGSTISLDVEHLGIASKTEPVVLLELDFVTAKRYLTYADWVCGRKVFPVFQIAWRDKSGKYPFDPRYDTFSFPQTALGSVSKTLFDSLLKDQRP